MDRDVYPQVVVQEPPRICHGRYPLPARGSSASSSGAPSSTGGGYATCAQPVATPPQTRMTVRARIRMNGTLRPGGGEDQPQGSVGSTSLLSRGFDRCAYPTAGLLPLAHFSLLIFTTPWHFAQALPSAS